LEKAEKVYTPAEDGDDFIRFHGRESRTPEPGRNLKKGGF